MATIRAYTTIEQSRKLAEILPLESADMHWQYIEEDNGQLQWFCFPKDFSINQHNMVSAWSLGALLNIITKQGLVDLRFLQSTFDNRGNRLTNVWCCTFENLGTVTLDLYADNPVDACYELILKLNELNLL